MPRKITIQHVALEYNDKEKADIFFIKILGLKLEKTFTENDIRYVYEWSPKLCGQYTIKIIVHDNAGQNYTNSMTLFKWRFHPFLILSSFALLVGLLTQI